MAAKSTLTPDIIMVKRLIDTVDDGDIRAYAYDSGQLSPLNNSIFGGQVKSPTMPAPQLSITAVNIRVEAVGDLDGGKVEINLGATQLFFAFADLTRPQCPDALNPETDSIQLTANQYNAIITPDVDIRWRLSYFGQARPCNDPNTYIRIRLDHQYRGPGFSGGNVKQTIWQSYHKTLVGGMGEPVVVTGQHQRDPHTGGFNVTHESREPRRQRLSMSGRRIFQEVLPDGRIRSFTGLRSRGELHGQMVSFSSSGSCQPI